jgi:WD40 repeat protein
MARSASGVSRRALRHDADVNNVRLSPDGERLITTTQYDQVNLWSTRTGERLGTPWNALDASFSPDSQQLIVADWNAPTIWDLMTGDREDPEVLATLAEAVAGLKLSREGKAESMPDPAGRLNDLRRRAGKNGSFVRWFLQDPWKRTISPSSAMTVEKYIQEMLAAGSDKAMLRQRFPGHPLLVSLPKPD